MRSFPSIQVSRHAVVVLVMFSCVAGVAVGGLFEGVAVAPRGMVSIIRGIAPNGGDTFGGKNCDFSGNIVLGGFFSLESDDKFFSIGSHQLTAYNLVVDHINRYKCGVRLTEPGPGNTLVERNYALEMRTYDDQSSATGSSAVAKMLATDPSVDIMVGGYSSTLTQPFAETADEIGDKLVLSAGAASTQAFADKYTTFGLLPPSNEYLSQVIKALATIHGAKTIATVWEDATFTRTACTSAPDLAEEHGMTMTSAREVAKTPNTTVLEPIAEFLKDEDPDVVITCVYKCTPWIQAMRRVKWSPKAQVFTICVGQEKFSSEASADTAYMMGVAPWDSSLRTKDAVTGWTAGEFASRFRSASIEEATSDVPYQAAMTASLISMLHQTIEGVNDFRQNGPQLADHISKNTFQTMGGNLAFDENGQSKAPSLTIQYDADGVVQTVYPPDASSGPMLYPMPTWDHRDCIRLSSCEGGNGNSTDGFFDTGNACDDRGMCVCGDPLNYNPVGLGAMANCVHFEEMNYIQHCLKVFSWVLSGLLLAFCVYCLGWTYCYRENSLVKVSQPLFLAFVVVGSILSILSMITMGVEGSYREDTENIGVVDAACMASSWLWGMGFVVTYSALFAKVWRVHKLYQLAAKMRRRKVDYKDVSFIFVIVLAAEMIVLTIYQVVSPRIWQRDVIVEDMSGYAIESIGRCDSEHDWVFQVVLLAMHVICLFVALVLCWRTRELPSDFSESSYIFLSVMFMFQILLLAVPVSAMVRNNANVYFFIRVGSVFLQNLSVLLLIFLPKMSRIYVGEDTEKSIKSAISNDGFRRSSLSRLRNASMDCHCNGSRSKKLPVSISRSQDSMVRSMMTDDSDDSLGLPDSEDLDEEDDEEMSRSNSDLKYHERTSKTAATNQDEELAGGKSNEDREVSFSNEEKQKIIEKQHRRVSWR